MFWWNSSHSTEKNICQTYFFLGSFMRLMGAVWISKSDINYLSREQKHFSSVLTAGEWDKRRTSLLLSRKLLTRQEPGLYITGRVAPLWAWAPLYPFLGNGKRASAQAWLYSTSLPVERDAVFLGWWKFMERTSAITFPRREYSPVPLLCQCEDLVPVSILRHFKLPHIWLINTCGEVCQASHPWWNERPGEQVRGC